MCIWKQNINSQSRKSETKTPKKHLILFKKSLKRPKKEFSQSFLPTLTLSGTINP